MFSFLFSLAHSSDCLTLLFHPNKPWETFIGSINSHNKLMEHLEPTHGTSSHLWYIFLPIQLPKPNPQEKKNLWYSLLIELQLEGANVIYVFSSHGWWTLNNTYFSYSTLPCWANNHRTSTFICNRWEWWWQSSRILFSCKISRK